MEAAALLVVGIVVVVVVGGPTGGAASRTGVAFSVIRGERRVGAGAAAAVLFLTRLRLEGAAGRVSEEGWSPSTSFSSSRFRFSENDG